MLQITSSISIDESDLVYDFIRSSGPGGQNVNKVATAVQLRFDVARSRRLPADVKERLVKLAGYRMSRDGLLVIEAKRYRTQEKNRVDAQGRLVELIRKAAVRPKKRRPTRPSASAKAKRIEAKKKRGQIKRTRQSGGGREE
ncbi:MAG TPA: alternative ribosome rescue aminoacyl-tRNA hydrolase ArfB [Anaerolineales bacterium]|nr:alternative ribosome rescue aminoacyl-tRNA hydrolase ArfB [Anaerolineales bacterium]